MAWLTLWAGPQWANASGAAADVPATADVSSGGSSASAAGDKTPAHTTTTHAKAAAKEGAWDALYKAHVAPHGDATVAGTAAAAGGTAAAAAPAKTPAVGKAAPAKTAAAGGTGRPTAQSQAPVNEAPASEAATADAPAKKDSGATVDADTARRVHEWEQQQQREAAARKSIHAADRAMRSGDVASDPVLWTARVVFPTDVETSDGSVAANSARGSDAAGDAAGESAGALAAQVPGATAGPSVTAKAQRHPGVETATTTAVLLPSVYRTRGSAVKTAPLFGSHEILLRQNAMAEDEGIDRVRDNADLATLRQEGKLVPLTANETVAIDEGLPENRRYARTWTADFVRVFARDFYAEFHQPVQVNSAVRTVAFQRHLERTNGNAAAATGDAASPHLTGEAVDIGKHGLTAAQIAWMRKYLAPLMGQGKIDVEEEFQQSCFHISVYETYLPEAGPRFTYAASRQAAELP